MISNNTAAVPPKGSIEAAIQASRELRAMLERMKAREAAWVRAAVRRTV
jgi:hypothetical protein